MRRQENRVQLWQKQKLGSYSRWEGADGDWQGPDKSRHPEGDAPPATLSELGERLLGIRPWSE